MHPDLSGNLDIASYRTTLGDTWSMQACGGKEDARVGGQADYAWIYPNFMLDRYGPWLNTITVIPLSAHRCTTLIDYFHYGTPDEEFLNSSLKDSDKVQQEDIEICQMVQTGLNSGVYQQGIYAPKFEGAMYQFHKLLSIDLGSTV
jgi:choline monooxygenase